MHAFRKSFPRHILGLYINWH